MDLANVTLFQMIKDILLLLYYKNQGSNKGAQNTKMTKIDQLEMLYTRNNTSLTRNRYKSHEH